MADKGLKITFCTHKRRNFEDSTVKNVIEASKIGGLDICQAYLDNGEEIYYNVNKGDYFYLYKRNGSLAELVYRSKNPYDFYKIVYGESE